MRIAIDAMGGDHAPEPIVRGAFDALRADEELSIVLVGDEQILEQHLPRDGALAGRWELDHTDQTVDMHDKPGLALRTKPRASVFRCWRLLADKSVDGMISAGNTGAVVAGGLMHRLFMENVRRPGIAAPLPTPDGWSLLLDVGANVCPKPEDLYQYAIMGDATARCMLGIDEPRIGLLNVGSESDKGNDFCRQVTALLGDGRFGDRFVGNVEGRDLCRGTVDVIVCDGFVGNVALKSCEGLADMMLREFHQEVVAKLNGERVAAQQALGRMAGRYNHREFGAAPLLGIDGVCLIAHGSSDARSIHNAIRSARRFADANCLMAGELAGELGVA